MSSHKTSAGESGKPKEVSLRANTVIRVSWSPVGYEGVEGLPTRGQDQRLQAVGTHSTLQPQFSLGRKTLGQGDLFSPGHTVGSDVLVTTSDGGDKGVRIGSVGPHQRGQTINKMVDSPPYERYGLDFIQHSTGYDHGRLKL